MPDLEEAVNYDFYDHPRERITCFSDGLTYRFDGQKAGQIATRKSAGAHSIGFYNASIGLVCARHNMSPGDGPYFNITNNDQTGGAYSATDNCSILN